MKKNFITLCLLVFSVGVFSQIKNLNEVRKSAESGNAESQYLLGWCYGNGKNGVAQNYEDAVYWLKQAADKNYEPAQYYLGWCYYYGHGMERDYVEAMNWYKKSADQGNSESKSMVRLLSELFRKSIYIENSESKFDPANPPILEIVSAQFVDRNGNNAIDANETCNIRLRIKNAGTGDAYNCEAKIFAADVKGVNGGRVAIKTIKSNEIKEIAIPVSASEETADGVINLYAKVDEPHGFGTDNLCISVNTKKFEAPQLQIVDYTATSVDGGSVLKKKSAFDVQILLQNIKYGTAENVVVDIELPQNVILMEKQKVTEKILRMSGGETKSLVYPLIVNNNYTSNEIPITFRVRENTGKYAEDRTITLNLNQALSNNKLVIEENKPMQQNFDIKIASIGSDVDKNIPETNFKNKNTFAVIIANESYNKEAGVPFAVSDGKVFSNYCKKTLGLPESNVHLALNATLNDIKHEIKWLKEVIDAYNGDAKVIFYYAGHGIPDEKVHSAYLLPVDGYGSDVTTGYALDSLYAALGRLPSKSVTVLLDACFSGAKREGDMLASARGVAIKAEAGVPVGNMVVFSATQGDETAYPYKEQGHGLFTYYLLKKLQETKGKVSLDALTSYVIEQVRKQSVVINGKSQTPTVNISEQIADNWKEWSFN